MELLILFLLFPRNNKFFALFDVFIKNSTRDDEEAVYSEEERTSDEPLTSMTSDEPTSDSEYQTSDEMTSDLTSDEPWMLYSSPLKFTNLKRIISFLMQPQENFLQF